MWTHAHARTQRNPVATRFLSLTQSHTHSLQAVSHWGEQTIWINLAKGQIPCCRTQHRSSWRGEPLTSFVEPSFLHYRYFIHNGGNVSWWISLSDWWISQKITVEIPELQQKGPQKGCSFSCLSPSQLLLKGSKKQTKRSPPLLEVHHIR